MLNANGPGFAGLYAGDIVEFFIDDRPRGQFRETKKAVVLPLLVFEDHVQVKHTVFGYTVNASNFDHLVRRGKRHIAADNNRVYRAAQEAYAHAKS